MHSLDGRDDPAAAGPPALPGGFGRRRMVFYSLLSGLCPLVPVPFLDDWLRDRIHRRLVREMAAHHGAELDGDAIRWLANGPPWSASGCARGCFSGAMLKAVYYLLRTLLRSIFRKLLYFLAIKDASDTFSLTFHRAQMLDHALAAGHASGKNAPSQVWHAMEMVRRETDPRPFEAGVRAVLRGSRATLRRGARLLRRAVRRRDGRGRELDTETIEAEAGMLDDLVADLDAEVDASSSYFTQLIARYQTAWSAQHGSADRGGAGVDKEGPG